MPSKNALEAALRDMMMEGFGQFKQMAINIGKMTDVGEDDASWIAEVFKADMVRTFGELANANMEVIKAAIKKQLATNGSKDETKKQLDVATPQVRKRPANTLETQEHTEKAPRRALLQESYLQPARPARPAPARGYTAQLRPARSKNVIVIPDDDDDDEDDEGDGVPAKVSGNTPAKALAPKKSRSQRTSSQTINYNMVDYYEERGVPDI
ncbi:uncharacterized protein F4817DRAFT_368842 [Daldinia loculata]|uniref:uncharacterized protein n=1 Tax=Daldinia loculata TaxID=103429 RepID=UPI0020C27273|nr:uncharacterized protein F4817DRAFT_368842 [Daldinia loculata]KAI1642948.1 hypothetical protein F4817DRAFT_368842 [Daldinia loculata]